MSYELDTNISSMMNTIKNTVNDWAQSEGGICIIAENDTEKLLTGFNNLIGPRCFIVFTGEEAHGDDVDQDVTGRVQRTFDCIIQRGKVLSSPRNTALTETTGPSKQFYFLVERCRDVIRGIQFPTPMVYSPIWYHNMRLLEARGWLMDSYVMSFSILCQIPRMQINPVAIDGNDGPFINLNDMLSPPNTTP